MFSALFKAFKGRRDPVCPYCNNPAPIPTRKQACKICGKTISVFKGEWVKTEALPFLKQISTYATDGMGNIHTAVELWKHEKRDDAWRALNQEIRDASQDANNSASRFCLVYELMACQLGAEGKHYTEALILLFRHLYWKIVVNDQFKTDTLEELKETTKDRLSYPSTNTLLQMAFQNSGIAKTEFRDLFLKIANEELMIAKKVYKAKGIDHAPDPREFVDIVIQACDSSEAP